MALLRRATAALSCAGGVLLSSVQAVQAQSDTERASPSNEAGTDATAESPGKDESVAPAIEAPRLVSFIEAAYPDVAVSERREGQVVLRLLIDADGRVSEAEVIASLGPDLDEAARQAALSFRFAPATRDGVPMPARIEYAYEFRLPAPEKSPELPLEEPEPALLPKETEAPIRVTVHGDSEAERLAKSAQAVRVIETEDAQKQSSDLGEVLARSQGVGVRRGGGLGSATRFSLNGLTDDQIRFFLDGVPLEFSGYPFGLANVPTNLVERVEVYRGVVPIRFGGDALGGAVNLVTAEDLDGTHAAGSYQVGSFGTHRATMTARHLAKPSGFFTRVGSFFDAADNDYPVSVEVPNDVGRPSKARAYRFHDGYRAMGGNIETGFVERPWAKRLLLRGFVTDYRKELQNNVVMTVPYGEAEYGQFTSGATLRYENVLADKLAVEAISGYVFGATEFVDLGECIYNWFGQCVRERRQPGETGSEPIDQVVWEHSAYGRLNADWQLFPSHSVGVSLSPTYVARTGNDRWQDDPGARDPLTAKRDLFTQVSGLSYKVDAIETRLQNILFGKSYFQVARTEEPLPGDVFREINRDTHRFGVGDSLRYRFIDWLYAKASYEYATRLPRTGEVFGDGVLVVANLELSPEVSHNGNLGLTIDALETKTGEYRSEVSGFVRDAKQLIVLLGSDRLFGYQNVFGARAQGLEAAAGWTSPRDFLAVDGNVTYLDFRNTSSEGTFGEFKGDRIPNRPYLFANGSARFELSQVAAPDDEISLTWNTRYVHWFYRGWESVGLRESKQVIPAQLLHALALTYFTQGELVALSFTGEVQNLTNQATFDFFGAERPGRSFYFKTTAEF